MTASQTGEVEGTEAAAYPVLRVRLRLVLLLVIIAIGALALWGGGPNQFVLTQWQFTYGDGVVRRALAGTIFHALGGATDDQVSMVSVLAYLATVALVAWAMAWCTVDERGMSRLRLALLLVWAVSPGGFAFLAANLGKFDTPTVALTLLACAALVGRQRAPVW